MVKDFLIWYVIFLPIGYLIGIPVYINYIKTVEVQKIITMIKIIFVIILFFVYQFFFSKYNFSIPFGIVTGILFGSASSHIGFKKRQIYKDQSNGKVDKSKRSDDL